MKQKLPEKIYIGTRKSEFPGDVVTTVADYYTKDAFAKVVDKLFA